VTQNNLQDRQEHKTIQQAGANDGAILEISEWKELHWCKLGFPDGKKCKADNTYNKHGDHASILPSSSSIGVETEWQEEQGKGSCDQQKTEHC